MRVIAGLAKGHRLKSPKGTATRPTTDRVRESLFSLLGPFVEDATVLDLFAGSGALGIEALSRGAKHAVFVDHRREAIDIVRANVTAVGLLDMADVYCLDAMKALAFFSTGGRKFSVVFLDPPYAREWPEKLLPAMADAGVVDDDGLVVLERSSREEIPGSPANFPLIREKAYGDTTLSFFRHRGVET